MSSNAVSNPPATKFQEILGFFKGNGANIGENVDTSKKKAKLTDEAKEALVQQIQENLSGIDLDSIKKTDNDGGLLTSEVLTLEDTPSDQIAKMNTVLSDTLKLIERSGGVDKTFLSAKSEEDVETRNKILELATVASMTKNDADNTDASTVKSLAEVVFSEVNPKLIKNPKAGLTQDETQAIKMMLFSNDDSQSFAGALKLLQSVKSYAEVAPDTLKEKEVDGEIKLKAKAGSFFKKIERALGNSEAANTVKQILKNTVDTALHGRLNEEQQAVINSDPSLNAVYEKVHNDLVANIEDTGRSKVLKPLKEEIDALFNDTENKVTQYFGSDISANSTKGLVRKVIQGLVNMVRPKGKGYAENAFGKGSFYETNQKIMNLANKAAATVQTLTTLESSVGTVQQRVDDGGAARLDVPMEAIMNSGPAGKDIAGEMIKKVWKESFDTLGQVIDLSAKKDNFEQELTSLLAGSYADVTTASGEVNSKLVNSSAYGDLTLDADVTNALNQQLTDLSNNASLTENGLTVKKRIVSGTDTFEIKQAGSNNSITVNQDTARDLIAAKGKVSTNLESLRNENNMAMLEDILKAGNAVYAKAHGNTPLDLNDPANVKTILNFILEPPSKTDAESNMQKTVKILGDSVNSIYFGLDASDAARNEDKKILEWLAENVPNIKTEVSQAKEELGNLSDKISKTVKTHTSTLAHMSLTSGAALKDGLLDSDGETFKVSNALMQNLFATALNAVQGKAGSELLKIQNQRNLKDADLKTVAKNLSTQLAPFVKSGQISPADPKAKANALRIALETMKNNASNDKKSADFAEDFLKSGENKDFFAIDGNSEEDKAKYNALISNLILSAYELKEDLNDAAESGRILAQLNTYVDDTKIVADTIDTSSSELKDIRSEVAKTRDVLSSTPDKKQENNLKKVIKNQIKDFSALASVGSLKDDIIQEMVKGVVEMAKNSAVKLEPLREALMAAEAPSDTVEADFLGRLKTALVAG